MMIACPSYLKLKCKKLWVGGRSLPINIICNVVCFNVDANGGEAASASYDQSQEDFADSFWTSKDPNLWITLHSGISIYIIIYYL